MKLGARTIPKLSERPVLHLSFESEVRAAASSSRPRTRRSLNSAARSLLRRAVRFFSSGKGQPLYSSKYRNDSSLALFLSLSTSTAARERRSAGRPSG